MPLPVPHPRPASPLLIITGIVFILAWLAFSILVIAMSLMGTLMANDGASASADSHSALILGVLISQVMIGTAGIPAGLAFFWQRCRRLLIILFIALALLGSLGLVAAFRSFLPPGS